MANITLSARASFDTSTTMYAFQLSGKVAGEDLLVGQPVYLKQSDDKIWKFAAGQVLVGIAARNAKAGQPVTVYGPGTRFHASDTALTANVYFAGAGGVIADAATTDDAQGAFIRVSANDLMVIRAGKLA
jgi:hypothetical protein